MSSLPRPLRLPKSGQEPSDQNRTSRAISLASEAAGVEGSPSSQESTRGRSSRARLASLATLSHLHTFIRRSSSTSTAIREEDPSQLGGADDAMIKEEHHSSASESKRRARQRVSDKFKAARRGSWIPIPEQTTRGLPRSMTLGNLSGITNSTHTHKEESRPDESRRQGRFLPQAASAGAERISFRSRIPSAPKGILTGNRSKPLMRSDTEPLLPLAGGTLPKTPATKENVLPRSLTRSKLTVFRGSHTEKPLPPCPSRRSISTTRSPTDEQLRIKYATTKKIDTHSDPAKARLVDMPRRALPRFNTQPDLSLTTTTITGSRIKSRTDIKHHTLLSPKHPPTPTQRSPLSTVTNFQRSTSRPRALYEKSTPTTPIPKSTTPAETPPPDTFNSAAVIDAEPIPYWSGRFLSQLDHWRTQDFNSRCTASVTSLPHHIYSKSQEMEQREQYCHILSSLYADCETEDAKESLQIFHSYLKALHVRTAVGEEEGIAARASWSNICGEGERIRKKSRGREETPESLGKMRRGTFMERLLGRRARM